MGLRSGNLLPPPLAGEGRGEGCLLNGTIPQRKEPSPAALRAPTPPASGRGEQPPPGLAVRQYRCYIARARLRRASGAIISPGPYRSFRELSLAGPVGPDIWCPPTFVGNSGIECFNGVRGFALFSSCSCLSNCVPDTLAVQFKVLCHAPPSAQLRTGDRGLQHAAASRSKHWRLWNTGSSAFADDAAEQDFAFGGKRACPIRKPNSVPKRSRRATR